MMCLCHFREGESDSSWISCSMRMNERAYTSKLASTYSKVRPDSPQSEIECFLARSHGEIIDILLSDDSLRGKQIQMNHY